MDKNFSLNIKGVLEPTVTDSEVRADGAFFKTVWPAICRELATFGVKNITTANLDAGGKNIALPADALHVGAGIK
jgi:hypothetical protein